MVDFSDISNNYSGSGSLNNDFQNEEQQTGDIPSNEIIKNRRR